MQQLTIEHNSNNTKVVSESKQEISENKREGHGRNIALTKKVYRIQNTDTYYVQSESVENIYYYVRYNFGVLEWCSCPDNSIRGIKCKHQFAIEYAIRLGTLKDIEKLPKEATRFTNESLSQTFVGHLSQEKASKKRLYSHDITNVEKQSVVVQQSKSKSWKDDEYDF